MRNSVTMLIAAPYLAVALYMFTRMFELALRPTIHPAVKLLATVTMLCAIVTAGIVIVVSGEITDLLTRLLMPSRTFMP